jgi:UDP-glucose 4-epimerase
MRVLLTGAFGNIGTSTLEELTTRDHQITCLDVKTQRSVKIAARFVGRIQIQWGDIRVREDVLRAVAGQDVVIHAAALIPRLSVTGLRSEEHPDVAQTVNVDGTRNIIEACQAQPTPPKLVFTSSLHVYGRTQHLAPPRTVAESVQPVEYYAQHKLECEQMLKASGLTYAILRLSAALPVRLILDPGMFEVPLNNRIEYVHSRDVGLALANAVDSTEIWGKTLLIGGGAKCRFIYRDMIAKVFDAIGVGMLPESAFTTVPYSVDWLDTDESQHLLHYQRLTLDDYARAMQRSLGYLLPLIRVFRPLVRYLLLRESSYYWQGQPRAGEVLRQVFA